MPPRLIGEIDSDRAAIRMSSLVFLIKDVKLFDRRAGPRMTLATVFILLPFLSGTATSPYAAQCNETQTSQPSASQPAEPASQSQSAPTEAVKPESIKPASGSKKAHAASRRRRRKPKAAALSKVLVADCAVGFSSSTGPKRSRGFAIVPPKDPVRHPKSSCATAVPTNPHSVGRRTHRGQAASNSAMPLTSCWDVSDQNLKKIAEMQLSLPAGQAMVIKRDQFMDQSKASVGSGDFERARTFAWKAQLLSEDLAKPEQ